MDQPVMIESSLVHSLFKCPLCHEPVRSATVINECLHRFCKRCITNYFANDHHKTCPVCRIVIDNPLQTLKSDSMFQRLTYKIFPTSCQEKFSERLIIESFVAHVHPDEISRTSSANESRSTQIERKINVYLEYWDISLDLFPNEATAIKLSSNCYLQCLENTPLAAIEKFLRMKYSLSSTLKIDLFYQSFALNTKTERLIDICHCFDVNTSIDLRFLISPHGYHSILEGIRQSKQTAVPLRIEVSAPPTSSSLSSTSSMESKLKVKLCRSQSSSNDWYIPQSTPAVHLPDLVNSCAQPSKPKKSPSKKKFTAPRRRIRFIPTMVKVPPSIFDRQSDNQYVFDSFSTRKTICKVSPCIPQTISSLFDTYPLDLSFK